MSWISDNRKTMTVFSALVTAGVVAIVLSPALGEVATLASYALYRKVALAAFAVGAYVLTLRVLNYLAGIDWQEARTAMLGSGTIATYLAARQLALAILLGAILAFG